MAKKQKSFRPKPRKPRGFRDRSGAELLAEQAMLHRITQVYASYGFIPLETPAFEYTDALGKFLPDVDRPNNGVFSLQDDDELSSPTVMYQDLIQFPGRADACRALDADGHDCIGVAIFR